METYNLHIPLLGCEWRRTTSTFHYRDPNGDVQPARPIIAVSGDVQPPCPIIRIRVETYNLHVPLSGSECDVQPPHSIIGMRVETYNLHIPLSGCEWRRTTSTFHYWDASGDVQPPYSIIGMRNLIFPHHRFVLNYQRLLMRP